MEEKEFNPRLVQLGSKPSARTRHHRLFDLLVDKFFVFGALSVFIGGVVLGAHLWLMLNGQMPITPNYVLLRSLHALIQTYLFFGLFILGFLLQTAPKILKVHVKAHPLCLAYIPVLCLGIYLQLRFPTDIIGPALLALPFLGTLIFLVSLSRRGAPAFRENYAWWVILGLAGMSLSPFYSIEQPAHAQLFIWSGVVPVTFAAGQQFLMAFLGGRRLEARKNRVLFCLYLVALITLLFAIERESENAWRVAGSLLFAVMMLFIYWTGGANAFKKLWRDPLAFGFISGYFWALLATGTLALFGAQMLDRSFHLLVLGWLTPLIIAVSSQVIRAIGGRFLLAPRALIILLFLWQLVPFGRGMSSLLPIPPFFSQIIVLVMSIVLGPWLIALSLSAVRIARRELKQA